MTSPEAARGRKAILEIGQAYSELRRCYAKGEDEPPPEMDPETMRRLKSLGYLQ